MATLLYNFDGLLYKVLCLIILHFITFSIKLSQAQETLPKPQLLQSLIFTRLSSCWSGFLHDILISWPELPSIKFSSESGSFSPSPRFSTLFSWNRQCSPNTPFCSPSKGQKSVVGVACCDLYAEQAISSPNETSARRARPMYAEQNPAGPSF